MAARTSPLSTAPPPRERQDLVHEMPRTTPGEDSRAPAARFRHQIFLTSSSAFSIASLPIFSIILRRRSSCIFL
jgi:hypothetical protein